MRDRGAGLRMVNKPGLGGSLLSGSRLLGSTNPLALDVAVGLQALHGSEIILGDLKPDNILLFDCDGERPQVAKLADFGASIFDADFEDGPVSYRGTARYNAPEQEGRLLSQPGGTAQTKEAFLKADICSLGPVVWEAMNNGDEYCEPDWLVESETEL